MPSPVALPPHHDPCRRREHAAQAAAAVDIGFSEVGHAPRIADGISAINPVSMARLIVRDPLAPSTRLAD
jgi:hypothetical protein